MLSNGLNRNGQLWLGLGSCDKWQWPRDNIMGDYGLDDTTSVGMLSLFPIPYSLFPIPYSLVGCPDTGITDRARTN